MILYDAILQHPAVCCKLFICECVHLHHEVVIFSRSFFYYGIQDTICQSPKMLQMIPYTALHGLYFISLYMFDILFAFICDGPIILDCGSGCKLPLVSLYDREEQGKVVFTSCFYGDIVYTAILRENCLWGIFPNRLHVMNRIVFLKLNN